MAENMPVWARKKFQERLAVVLGYYEQAAEAQKFDSDSFKPSKFIRIYASSISMSHGHIYRLLQHYREDGEEGLISKDG
jgi:hypothetical protein